MSLLRDLVKKNLAETTISKPSLISKIEEFLDRYPEDERRGGYHPSDLSKAYCPRELAALRLKIATKKRKVPSRLRRVFDNGHFFHERMQGYAHEAGLVYNHPMLDNPEFGRCEESRLDHPVGLTGNTDNILSVGAYLLVVDYKSSRSGIFNNLMSPLTEHKNQVILYMGMIRSMIDVTRPMYGVILYENKDDQSLKEFHVEWDTYAETYFAKVVSDLELVNAAVEANNIFLAPCACGKCPTQ